MKKIEAVVHDAQKLFGERLSRIEKTGGLTLERYIRFYASGKCLELRKKSGKMGYLVLFMGIVQSGLTTNIQST